ncbi:MAG: hypothetical protein GYB41_07660, partial [Oceanospirillales bacterium]|nr:hypothetical protein [Oceanospirillales bacterium]
MLPTTPVSNGTARSNSSPSLEQLLPSGGRELPAVVKQVAAGDAGGKVFRIQVEANNRLLELISRAPLNAGDRVTLSRSPAGELLLSLLAPTRPNTSPNAAAGRPALLLQASAAQVPQLQQSLPLNTPRPAQVISSTPTPSPAPPPVDTSAPQSKRPAAPASNPGPVQNPLQPSVTPTQGQPNTPQTQTQTTVPPNSRPGTPANGAQTAGSKASVGGGSSAAARPEVAAPAPAAKVQVYRAQLQQMTSMTPSAPQPTSLAAPATVASSASTVTTALSPPSAQAPANTQPGPLPTQGGRSAPAPMPAASPATSTTASRPPAPTPTTAAIPARVSHSGNTLLQTLGQQQVRQAQPHLVQLRMDTQQLQLLSPRPLQAGQQVILTRTSADQVQLSSPPPIEAITQRPASQVALQNALREALPQQIPFGDALNQLVQLSQAPATRSNSAINQLVQSMLSLFSVTPGDPGAEHSIKRNLQQGGLMTESQLARSAPGDKPAADIKQHLGQLLKAAEQLPNEARQQMHRLVDALQARTTTQ